MVIRWLILAVLFVASLCFASNYGGTIPYMLLYFVGAVPIVSGIYTLWVEKQFRFYQRIEEKVIVKGEPVNYYFCISNEEKFFYDSIAVDFFEENARIEGLEQKAEYDLLPGEKKEVRAALFCNYRGEYAVGACRFHISDYLHLFSTQYVVETPLKVVVLPRIVPWKYEKEILGESFEQVSVNPVMNGEVDVQVRNYYVGDEMRQIHWKASAKARKLMVRERCEEPKQELAIFFDLQKQEGTENEQRIFEDEMVEQVVAAVYACRKKNISCIIFLNDSAGTRLRVENQEQWEEFYQRCGRLQFLSSDVVKEFDLNFKSVENVRHALFFTGEVDGALLDWIKSKCFGMETNIVRVGFSGSSQNFGETGIRVYEDWIE